MLEGKNLRLRLLERRDVELIRTWRNSAEVFQFFSAKEQISEVEQEKWFEKTSLDKSSYYFIIEAEKGAIGTCNIKNIHWVHRTANWGIYFFPPTGDHGFLPVEATIVLFDYAFNCLNLRKICGEILAGNQRPLDLNEAMGCKVEGVREKQVYQNGEYVDLVLVGVLKESYFPAVKKYRELIFRDA